MLSIILTILKIIGIILLIILILILTVLIVPIRYEAKCEKKAFSKPGNSSNIPEKFGRDGSENEYKKTEVVLLKGKVHWLLRGILLLVDLKNKKVVLKLLGITVIDSSKPKKKQSNKINLHNIEQLSKPDSDDMADEMNSEETISLQTKKNTLQEVPDEIPKSNLQKEDSRESDFLDELSSWQTDYKEEDFVKKSLNEKDFDSDEKNSDADNKNNTFFDKLKIITDKIKSVFNKIKDICSNIPFYFKEFCDKINIILAKKDKLTLFLEDKENKKTFRLAKRQFFRLMRHILPRKLKGYLHFGFDNPTVTGYTAGFLAIFYGSYGRNITIQPDFENEVLECNLYFKGRIRIITVIIIGVRLFIDKNFRKLVRQVRHMR